MHQKDFEHLLPSAIRMRAARQRDGDLGWQAQDMNSVVDALVKADLAITCMDVWGVADSSPESLAAFITSGTKVLTPESRTIDGRIIWNTLLDTEGELASFGFEDFRANPDSEWSDFVQSMAYFTLQAVEEVKASVAPAMVDKLHFCLCVSSRPKEDE